MKRYGNLWEQLISFENRISAFRKAVKGKGYKPCTLFFIKDFEHNILQLQHALISKTYKPVAYTTFFIFEPKKRMISAAPFADRVVHHCLINVIEPIFENTFIHQSYANQVKKGIHRAIRDVQNAMRLHRYTLKGLIFPGQTVFPDRRILPKSNIRRFVKRMKRFQRMYATGEISLDTIRHSLVSWLGHAKQAHTFALRESLLNKLHFERKVRYRDQ